MTDVRQNQPGVNTLEVTGAASSAAVLSGFPVEVLDFSLASLHITSTGTATLIAEVSNDNTNWVGAYMLNWQGGYWTGNLGVVNTSNLMSIVSLQGARYLRLRLSSYTSGTVTVVVELSSIGSPINIDTELTSGTIAGDAQGNPTSQISQAFLSGYNGTTWDRLRSTTANGLAVDVTRVTGTVTVESELPTAAALADATANPTIPSIGALGLLFNGTTWDRMRGDTTNGLDVDVTRLPYDIAHDAADSGNPIKVGAKAANALPTAVANNDRTNNISDLWGRQLTSHIDPAMQTFKSVNVTTTQTGTDVWSPTSGKKIAVTYLSVASYGTTAARVILWFGDNADTTYTAGTDQLLWAGSFAPSATAKPGMVIAFQVPIFCTTADRELHLTTDAGISLDIAVYGYEF